jgi:hypothetical protein
MKTSVAPKESELSNFQSCKDNELRLNDYKEFHLNGDVNYKFNNKNYIGKIKAIIKDSNYSDKVFIGGQFDDIPDKDPMHPIFEFDNQFFLDSSKLKARLSLTSEPTKTVKMPMKQRDLKVEILNLLEESLKFIIYSGF